MSNEETNVRIGADTADLRQGMTSASGVVDRGVAAIIAAINNMNTVTSAAVNGMHSTMSLGFSAMGADMHRAETSAQETGAAMSQTLEQSNRPLNDNTRQLRDGTRSTTSATKELLSAMGGLLSIAAITKVISDSVQAYQKAESAMYGLASAARYTGNEFGGVMNAAKALANDGLMSLSEASKGLQNLLMRGFSLQESIDMMNRFRDSAAFNRQASLQFGEAVVTATEGIKNENSILVDNAGVTKNVSVMWKEYAQTIGTTADKLTIGQKRQAEYNGIMKETEGQVGNAAKMATLFSGELAKARQESELAKAQFAQAMIPTLAALLRAMAPVFDMARAFVGGFQMMVVAIAGFVDKAAAIYDAGGIVGLIFSADARAQVKAKFAQIEQAVEESKAEIFKTMEGPVAVNADMFKPAKGPLRKDPDAPKEKAESRIPAWKAELEHAKEIEGEFFKDSNAADLAYWEEKIGHVKGSGKVQKEESRAIQHEIFKIKKDMQREELQSGLEEIKLRLDQEQGGSAARVKIWDEAVKKIGVAYGLDSKQYTAALREKEKLAREHANLLVKLADEVTEKNREISKIGIEIEAQNAEFKAQIGVMSAEEQIRIARTLEARKADIEIGALREKLTREKAGTIEHQKLNDQIEIAQAKHAAKMGQIDHKAALEQTKTFNTVFSSIQNSFSSAVQGMILSGDTLGKSLKKIASAVLGTFIDLGVKMLFDWVKKQIMMTTVTATQETARTGIAATAETTRSGLAVVGATTQIGANAASAAAGAASSQAGIPIVGPILAGVAMAAMLALVLGLSGGMKSAAGGWDNIPEDQVAQVHKNEMILPAELAEGVRNNIGSGAKANAGGGGGHVYISAVDARGVKRLLSDNGGALAGVLKQKARNFSSVGKSTKRG